MQGLSTGFPVFGSRAFYFMLKVLRPLAARSKMDQRPQVTGVALPLRGDRTETKTAFLNIAIWDSTPFLFLLFILLLYLEGDTRSYESRGISFLFGFVFTSLSSFLFAFLAGRHLAPKLS